MNKYSAILQLVAVLVVVFIGYLLFKYCVYLVRKNRLQDFSLKVKGSKNGFLVRSIKKTGSFLRKFKFIKVKKYNSYARYINNLDDGYDILASKILCSLFLLFLYLIVSLLYKSNLNIIIVLVCLVIGYVLLDFYYIYNGRNTYRLVNKDLLGAVIIMNNDFKANRSVEQAINDVIDRKNGPISIEFKKIRDDVELGLSYGEAFLRMYKRTGINVLLDVSHAFSLYTLIGSDLIDVFDQIEKKIIEEEKFTIQVRALKTFNKFFKILFYILPVFIVCLLFMVNPVYKDLLTTNKGLIVVCIMIVLYIVYIVTINKIVRRYSYDNQ